ncbi:hypothetical protein OHD62_19285 [Mesorhizobium sp. YC-39]|uniref:hypothetical protein n=1 Tax=unclassified Mesorhizobium TaxID=325217 RepID=UPI0021E7DDEE|nr:MULTISPECIES: hypothetical protein [unclassified Mesorhizobium]MCV3209988.1 hypothetical protein [Mesorhizobium sp. YC-2]MCV3230518.1 hypothetical protein [Mesorhizobium sp. YC-39]
MFRNCHCGIQPEEIQLLQRVFDQLCADVGLQRGSEEAELIGASLIEMFQAGVRDEARLLAQARVRRRENLMCMV